MEKRTSLKGFAIVVADRGFVYIGEVDHNGEWCVISGARNIRYWGTDRGLGQLALEGPNEKTKLDAVGTVRIPNHSVMHIIDTESENWSL